MSKNPWTLQRLTALVGQQEGPHLEFKSSKPLTLGFDKGKRESFVSDLTCHVSAFLNAEGGTLVIGLEEQKGQGEPDTATHLSDGAERSSIDAKRLEDAICDRISPSVASYVHVYPIKIGEKDGEALYAYAVEVMKGITAYQADNKLYYVRRSYSSVAMDDKDIRLRMLTDDRPRAEFVATVTSQSARASASQMLDDYVRSKAALEKLYGPDVENWPKTNTDYIGLLEKAPNFWPSGTWAIWVKISVSNIGNKTIREFFVDWSVSHLQGLTLWDKPVKAREGERIQFHFEANRERDGSTPMYPGLDFMFGHFSVRSDLQNLSSDMSLVLRAKGYLDDGFPFTYEEDIGKRVFDEFSRFAEFIDHIRNHDELPPETSQ